MWEGSIAVSVLPTLTGMGRVLGLERRNCPGWPWSQDGDELNM